MIRRSADRLFLKVGILILAIRHLSQGPPKFVMHAIFPDWSYGLCFLVFCCGLIPVLVDLATSFNITSPALGHPYICHSFNETDLESLGELDLMEIHQGIWQSHNKTQHTKTTSTPYGTWGPFHDQFFVRHSNSMESPSYSHPICSNMIAMKFCTGHDRGSVVHVQKCCSDTATSNGDTHSPQNLWNGPLIYVHGSDVLYAVALQLYHQFQSLNCLCPNEVTPKEIAV